MKALEMSSMLTKGLQLSRPVLQVSSVCKGQVSGVCADTFLELLQWLARPQAGGSLCWTRVGPGSAQSEILPLLPEVPANSYLLPSTC